MVYVCECSRLRVREARLSMCSVLTLIYLYTAVDNNWHITWGQLAEQAVKLSCQVKALAESPVGCSQCKPCRPLSAAQ